MSKPVLLTVDDDPEVLSAIARDLRKHYGQDYRVLRADSGPSALELLQELKQRADPVALVLSDQRMPGMDGVTLLAETLELHPKSKRALLTAYADTNAARNRGPSYEDVDLRLTWRNADDRFLVEVFGLNVTDEVQVANLPNGIPLQARSIAGFAFTHYRPPQQYGVRIAYEY